jgi:hypothetical protein
LIFADLCTLAPNGYPTHVAKLTLRLLERNLKLSTLLSQMFDSPFLINELPRATHRDTSAYPQISHVPLRCDN